MGVNYRDIYCLALNTSYCGFHSLCSLPEHTTACCHRAGKLPRPCESRSQQRTADHIHSPPALNCSYRGLDRNEFRPLRFSLPQVSFHEKKTTCETENLRGPEKWQAHHGRRSNEHRFFVPWTPLKPTSEVTCLLSSGGPMLLKHGRKRPGSGNGRHFQDGPGLDGQVGHCVCNLLIWREMAA